MENISAYFIVFFSVTQVLTYCKAQCTDYFIMLQEKETGLTPLAKDKIFDWRRTADFNETNCLLEFDCPEDETESHCEYYTNIPTTESTDFVTMNTLSEDTATGSAVTSFLPEEIIEYDLKTKSVCTDYIILLEETETGLIPLAKNKVLDWRRTADYNETICLVELDCPEHETESNCTIHSHFSTTEPTDIELLPSTDTILFPFGEIETTSYYPIEIDDQSTTTESIEVETTTRSTKYHYLFNSSGATSFKDNKNKLEIIVLAGVGCVSFIMLLYISIRNIIDRRHSRDYYLSEP